MEYSLKDALITTFVWIVSMDMGYQMLGGVRNARYNSVTIVITMLNNALNVNWDTYMILNQANVRMVQLLVN